MFNRSRIGLRELGWIDGRTVHLLERYDNGDPTQLPRLAAELVALGVNVFYVTDAAVPAASKASKTIPIVGADMFDPVLEGFTKSMARPDRNITGVSLSDCGSSRQTLATCSGAYPELAQRWPTLRPQRFWGSA